MAAVTLRSPAGKWVMVATILASAMAFIDATALNVVLPALQKSLGASGADLFWMLNAYLLMLASLILIGGALGDKLGRKKVYIVGVLIFIVGSAACGFAPDIQFLIVFRVVQGIGGAFMIPGSLALISSSIVEQERGKAIGTWSAATTMVTLGGPILGGALADAGLWRYIFFINVPIGIVAFLILWRRVAETRDAGAEGSLDYPGALLIAFGLALVTFGFLRVPALGFDHWQVVGGLGLGAALIVAFVVVEAKSRHPMMPLHLFKNRVFSATNLLTFFLYAGLGSGMLFLSLNLVQAQGYSQLQSGMTFLPFTLLMILVARPAGGYADKVGPRRLLIIGPALTGAGLLAMSFAGETNGPSSYWTSFLPGIALLGLGMSLTVAPLTTAVMRSVNDELSGTASGVNNAITRIANVIAYAIFGALAVMLFSNSLEGKLKGAALSPEQHRAVMSQAVDLGDAQAPKGMDAGRRKVVMHAYRAGFVDTYALIMRISAGMAFLGALMAVLFVDRKPPAVAGGG